MVEMIEMIEITSKNVENVEIGLDACRVSDFCGVSSGNCGH